MAFFSFSFSIQINYLCMSFNRAHITSDVLQCKPICVYVPYSVVMCLSFAPIFLLPDWSKRYSCIIFKLIYILHVCNKSTPKSYQWSVKLYLYFIAEHNLNSFVSFGASTKCLNMSNWCTFAPISSSLFGAWHLYSIFSDNKSNICHKINLLRNEWVYFVYLLFSLPLCGC